MKPDGRDDCFVRMTTDDHRGHLDFWCSRYEPCRIRNYKNEYNKGEEVCLGCCIPIGGVLFRAPFQCTREKSPTILRFACPRNIPTVLNGGASTGAISTDYQKIITNLFGWLYGIETKRSVAKKAVKASKVADDQYRADNGKVARILQDYSKRKEVSKPEAQTGTQEIKQQIVTESIGSDSPDTGLQELPQSIPLRDNNPSMSRIINDIEMQPVRAEDDLQKNRERSSDYLQAVFEPAMNEEYDTSYKETSCHACITCKCGKKVWYGCSKKKHHTRPKFCKSCTEKEALKLRDKFVDYMDAGELQRLIDSELRRVIS